MKLTKSLGGIFLEAALIVFGVSVSFYVESWRQQRADAEKGKGYLRQIDSDLEEDSIQLGRLQNKYLKLEKMANRFIFSYVTYNGGKLPISNDSIARIIYDFTRSESPYDPLSTSYSSVKFSGQLDLIKNNTLEKEIISYYERNPVKQRMQDANNWTNSKFLSFVGEQMDVLDFYWLIFAHHPEKAKTDFYRLYNDNFMKSAMGFSQDITEELSRLISVRIQSNRELRSHLKTELSK